MLSIIIIAVLSLVTLSSACPEGEMLVKSWPPDCNADYCPLSSDSSQSCTFSSNKRGGEKCVCGMNRLRDRKTEKCVAVTDCPPYKCNGQNEEYVKCPPICPAESCKEYLKNSTCAPPASNYTVIPCRPQCRCIKGYYRNNNNTCVLASLCGDSTTTESTTTAMTTTTSKPETKSMETTNEATETPMTTSSSVSNQSFEETSSITGNTMITTTSKPETTTTVSTSPMVSEANETTISTTETTITSMVFTAPTTIAPPTMPEYDCEE